MRTAPLRTKAVSSCDVPPPNGQTIEQPCQCAKQAQRTRGTRAVELAPLSIREETWSPLLASAPEGWRKDAGQAVSQSRPQQLSAPQSNGNTLPFLARRSSIRATGLSHLWVRTCQCQTRRLMAGFSGLIALGCNRWKQDYVRPTRCSSHWFCRRALKRRRKRRRSRARPLSSCTSRAEARAQSAPVIYVYGCHILFTMYSKQPIINCNTASVRRALPTGSAGAL